MCILRFIKTPYKDKSGKRGQRRRGFINLLFFVVLFLTYSMQIFNQS